MDRKLGIPALLLCFSCFAWAQDCPSGTPSGRCVDVGAALRSMVKLNAGGPYVARAGFPAGIRGSYEVNGQSENMNKLRIIGQALQGYIRANGTLPPAAMLNWQGKPTVSWRVLILPYLGQKALYDQFDLTRSWDDPVNLQLLTKMPDVYRKFGAAFNTTETGFAGIEGRNTLFQRASAQLNGGKSLAGLSPGQVLAVGPVGDFVSLPWTAPGDIPVKRVTALGRARGFSGYGSTFTPLLFLDGSVYLMPNDVDSSAIATWTDVGPQATKPGRCICSPPGMVDVKLTARWDLGPLNVTRTDGLSASFVASQPGIYPVTLRAYDRFGNEYTSSTRVEVR